MEIIDRTIVELLLLKPTAKKHGLIRLAQRLNEHGVNTFEIDRRTLARLQRLPAGLEFIFRVDSANDIPLFRAFNIRRCIVHEKTATVALLKQIKNAEISVTLEVEVSSESSIPSGVAAVMGLLESVDVLRIMGIGSVKSFLWVNRIKNLVRNTNVKIDICPSDHLSMGTSIAIEAVLNDVDCLSMTFGGIGKTNGHAAFEEVMQGMIILKGIRNSNALKTLPETVALFRKVSGRTISPIKPVIGKNIFVVESGLHADGIEKNPVTYELYSPDLVGQERLFLIGKHSGKASILSKLKAMGVGCKMEQAEGFLRIVRDKSIYLGRNLNEQETSKLFSRYDRRIRSEEQANG